MASHPSRRYSSRVKLSLFLNMHITVKMCMEVEVQFHAFLALDGGRQSAPCPGYLTP